MRLITLCTWSTEIGLDLRSNVDIVIHVYIHSHSDSHGCDIRERKEGQRGRVLAKIPMQLPCAIAIGDVERQ